MDEQNISKEKQLELLPIMKENYDGYKFRYMVKKKYIILICAYIF